GDRVRRGDVVGVAGAGLHFGVRAGDRYLDPELLFGGGPVEVHLVPPELRRPRPQADERRGPVGLVGGALAAGGRRAGAAVGWGADAAAWAAGRVVDVGQGVWSLADLVATRGWEAARGELERLWLQLVVLNAYVEQVAGLPGHLLVLQHRAQRFRDAQE